MYFPNPVKDAYSALNIATAGCHHLAGFQSLALVRARLSR
jgi:anionic cell wall polymer biosynthesis LytR-Cps2A-Psr (LCP) family protein